MVRNGGGRGQWATCVVWEGGMGGGRWEGGGLWGAGEGWRVLVECAERAVKALGEGGGGGVGALSCGCRVGGWPGGKGVIRRWGRGIINKESKSCYLSCARCSEGITRQLGMGCGC